MRRAPARIVLLLGLLGGMATPALGQEGWVIERFHAEIQIRSDASLAVVETIDVDFGSLDRHGIFREIPVRYLADDDHDRVYRLTVGSVLDGGGRDLPYEVSSRGANRVIRIGDPDRTVSGRQTYRIVYDIQGALNAFASHDELFWDVNGEWPVPLGQVSARIAVDGAMVARAECFEGGVGSTAPCRVTREGDLTFYRATRGLAGSEQLTIVAALPKGAVTQPAPIIERARRDVDDLFELGPLTVGTASLILLAVLGGLTGRWLTSGRDRRYLKRYYLDPTSREELVGPLDRDVIVTEYEPPELLRPAEIGLLLDERADTKDLTATIVHLAVRGYLTIEEVPAPGGSGTADRVLRRKASFPDDRLAGYEKRILDGLFEEGPEVKLSDLRGTFHGTLHEAQKDLYRDAVERRWSEATPTGPGSAGRWPASSSCSRASPLRSCSPSRWAGASSARRSSSAVSSSSPSAERCPTGPRTAGSSCCGSLASAATWRPPRQSGSGSPSARTSSPNTCHTRSCSGPSRSGRKRSLASTCRRRRPGGTRERRSRASERSRASSLRCRARSPVPSRRRRPRADRAGSAVDRPEAVAAAVEAGAGD